MMLQNINFRWIRYLDLVTLPVDRHIIGDYFGIILRGKTRLMRGFVMTDFLRLFFWFRNSTPMNSNGREFSRLRCPKHVDGYLMLFGRHFLCFKIFSRDYTFRDENQKRGT